MSEFSQFSQQREFNCPECNGRIVIPSNLPATTGPCPLCQATITSPEPVVPSSVIKEQDNRPKVETSPAPTHSPAPTQEPKPEPKPASTPEPVSKPASASVHTTPDPAPVETPTSKTESQPEEEEEEREEKPVARAKPTKRPIAIILILFLLLIGLGAGAYFAFDMFKPKNDSTALSGINQPRPAANPTLQKYLAASNLDEKSNYVYNAEELRPKMESFYKEGIINEADTPANSFSLVQLPEADRNKGFILLLYDQPAPAALNELVKPKSNSSASSANQRTKVLAFLKETEQGVKLDWEVFAQTKYRTFNNFIKTPINGKSEVFRLIVTHTPSKQSTEEKPNSSYQFSDPIHTGDTVKITPDPQSQAAQILSILNEESAKQAAPVNRTATVELIWAGDPNNPKLDVKRVICWEFLGLGGKEIAEIPPTN